jgi:two-component system, sensor histidine kinase PdtaS
VATLPEIAHARTALAAPAVDHLQRLLGAWALLADLSFSDMLLMARADIAKQPGGRDFVVLAQVRPNNSSTTVTEDLVGTTQRGARWPLVEQVLASGQRHEGLVQLDGVEGPVPTWALPVGVDGTTVAVVVRLQGQLRGPASLYEQAYLEIFSRLCSMVADGSFPFREADLAAPGLPRVGDGIILIDGKGLVEFATPNATQVLHRLGVYTSAVGRSLKSLGLRVRALERSLEFGLPEVEEIDRGSDIAILFHCVPLLADGQATGVLVLVRDVSDLRHLNRLVVSKDAAIREVHHRVKNNLQTISSLLRLQARRDDDQQSRSALLEAERRIRSIAVVHEVLSREPGDEVDFSGIVESIVTMVEEQSLLTNEIELMVSGDLGVLSTDVATPLAIVIAELLMNAVEHAFLDLDEGVPGLVALRLTNDGAWATAEVRDNGRGLPDNFSVEVPTSLGLSIVRDLVRNQLRGSIAMTAAPDGNGGTVVTVRVPVGR